MPSKENLAFALGVGLVFFPAMLTYLAGDNFGVLNVLTLVLCWVILWQLYTRYYMPPAVEETPAETPPTGITELPGGNAPWPLIAAGGAWVVVFGVIVVRLFT